MDTTPWYEGGTQCYWHFWQPLWFTGKTATNVSGTKHWVIPTNFSLTMQLGLNMVNFLQNTQNSWSMRVRYGMSFMSLKTGVSYTVQSISFDHNVIITMIHTTSHKIYHSIMMTFSEIVTKFLQMCNLSCHILTMVPVPTSAGCFWSWYSCKKK